MSFYVTSDLHGCLENYYQILDYLKPNDRVYFLGDACDRGKDGWELIKLILQNRQFIYLKGNHEDMNMNEYHTYIHEGIYPNRYDGRHTFQALLNDPWRNEWVNHIRKLPVAMTYYNAEGKAILLSHAGYTPKAYGQPLPDENTLLWDRHHFHDPWDEVINKNKIVVHGHTCVQMLGRKKGFREAEDFEGAFWYANNHKVDIDNAVFVSGRTVLLNLDTWEEKIFQAKDMSVFDF